ncbi:hypothetical protein EU546_05665 [Candidatus Thorarchaeota archaeon]|nr:MAG: hypothetical protein EU546_05665 [Candidatus Thorarchaeota archaeon]
MKQERESVTQQGTGPPEEVREDAKREEIGGASTEVLLDEIQALTEQISEIASSKTEKWNERLAEKDLDALLKRIYDAADRIREATPQLDVPEAPQELDTALNTVRIRMLQAREDIRRRTVAEREYYQLIVMLNQAVLQVKSGMKTGDEAREIVRNALTELESYPEQPYFSQQLIRRAERAKEEAHDLLTGV